MYKISELGAMVGLSRTALLYYEKINLIQGRRQHNGYRVYSDKDLQRIRLIQRLQAGGLTLKECKACIEAKIERELLINRLNALEKEIEQKKQSRNLLAAMLGDGDLKKWHKDLDSLAPDAHLDWLMKQGFSEKEALRLKWLSKDMNEHDLYMNDFMKIYETLECWGPGSDTDTIRAFRTVSNIPKTILDIGCGKGLSTKVLAEHSNAMITALDNEQSALDRLEDRFKELGFSERLKTINASMTELPFPDKSFDLIWAEGSTYIMGIENALANWKPFLTEGGVLVFSDLVWKTAKRSSAAIQKWSEEYPDMQDVEARLKQIHKAGYQVINHFPMSEVSWMNYYGPLQNRLIELESELSNSTAYQDIKQEVEIATHYSDEFGYHMFIISA